MTAALNCLWAAFFVYMIVLSAAMASADGGVWIALLIALAALGPWMTIDAWRSTRRLVDETEAAVALKLKR